MNPTVPAASCACIDEAPASIWWRIGGGAFLAMNGMVFSMALNGSDVTPEERFSLELTSCFVALPVFLLLASEFVQSAWRSLRRRQLSIELLFLVGIVASLAGSALYFIRGTGAGYADVAAMLLVIYALGRQVGAYGKRRVLASLEEWAPEKRLARRMDGSVTAASALLPGDRIRILPGEAVPVDATVVAGSAFVQETSLTGESLAVRKCAGDTLLAGSYPLDGSLDAVATKPVEENQIDRIRTLVEGGLNRPGREQKIAMRAVRWFVPLVFLASAATFWFQWQYMPWDRALFIALAVAVIACPCALGFATPLAVWTAIARLREMGIAARSGDAVEKLAEIDTVVFDKTGTLTLPEEYTVRWDVEPEWQPRIAELRFLLREAEQASRHALARTLEPLWKDEQVAAAAQLSHVRLLPGSGIEAEFDDGRVLFAGVPTEGAGSEKGNTGELSVMVDGRRAATIHLRERAVASVSPAVASLEAIGVDVMLATGDRREKNASAIPIRQRWTGQTPDAKHQLVSDLQTQGKHVLFAGDGINDSAAMAWSHIACAAPDSSEVVREVSDLMFLHRDWDQLARAITLARKTRTVVRWSIGFSLAYNLSGMSFAAAGLLPPLASALLMMASSLTVIVYSMHLMEAEDPA